MVRGGIVSGFLLPSRLPAPPRWGLLILCRGGAGFAVVLGDLRQPLHRDTDAVFLAEKVAGRAVRDDPHVGGEAVAPFAADDFTDDATLGESETLRDFHGKLPSGDGLQHSLLRCRYGFRPCIFLGNLSGWFVLDFFGSFLAGCVCPSPLWLGL